MKVTLLLLTSVLSTVSPTVFAKDLFAGDHCKAAYEYHFLNRAAAFQDFVGVELLLEGGADPNGSGYEKITECIRLPNEFSSPLALAVRMGDIDIVRLLLSFGAYPNLAEGESITPMSLARSTGHSEILKLLIQHGGK